MKPFTTNLALKVSLDSRRESKDFTSVVLPKEILTKLKLIEKHSNDLLPVISYEKPNIDFLDVFHQSK